MNTADKQVNNVVEIGIKELVMWMLTKTPRKASTVFNGRAMSKKAFAFFPNLMIL